MLDADINFENYLDEDASGGIMLESYNEKKNKGDFTLSFSGSKMKSICGIKNILNLKKHMHVKI